MKRTILLNLFFFVSFLLNGQDTTITLFFKSGQSHLTSSQQKNIDNLQLKPVTKITIDGYADTVGAKSFNKKLSYKRAKTTANSIKTTNKNIIGNGESKEKKVSLNKMRKVVVKVWYDKQVAEIKPIEQPKDLPLPIDSCAQDTMLLTESGSMIKINKCYFEKIKHCFSYKEYLDAKSVQEAGLRTIDEKGDPIESGGMLDIRFCADTCIKTPIIIYLPVPECLSQQAMTLWTLNPNNTWRNSRNKIEIVKIKGKEFYKLEIYCPGKLNCDKPKPSNKKVKIKVKNGLKIKSATLSYNCPIYSINGKVKRKRKVVTFPYNCPTSEPFLHLKAYNKDGDTLIINNKNINQYQKRQRLRSRCDCSEKATEKFLGVFKIRKKYLYKKYKIYRKDFI